VAATSVTSGFRPAAGATGLSAAASTFFFQPYGLFATWPEHVRVGLFEMAIYRCGLTVATLGGELRNSDGRSKARPKPCGQPWLNEIPRWSGSTY
jgi:hypothetical protein